MNFFGQYVSWRGDKPLYAVQYDPQLGLSRKPGLVRSHAARRNTDLLLLS
jgi:hypothetical protein